MSYIMEELMLKRLNENLEENNILLRKVSNNLEDIASLLFEIKLAVKSNSENEDKSSTIAEKISSVEDILSTLRL